MALHTKKDFSKICGLKTNALSVYIGRKNIILSGDYIDDAIPQNADFLRKWVEKNSDNSQPNIITPEIGGLKPNVREPEDLGSGYNLEKKLKQQELLKKEAETRLLNLREEKIRGEVVPVDLVKQFFILHNQSTMTAHKEGIEYLLIEISKQARLTGEQLADLRGKMTQFLNEGLRKSIEITNKNMKSVISEFSLKREVGEHD